MKNKKESKEKAVNEIKYRKVKREEWASFLNVFSSLGLAIVSTIIALRQEKIDIVFCILISFSSVFVVLGIGSIILLYQNMKKDKKYKEDYNYYVESKKISDALLKAMKRTSFAKTNSILRSTYGTVPEWHPIDYCKNVLVYDVHEHLRDICIRIKELVVDLAPDEFNDDMVTVDIAFEYPSDKDFVRNRKNELESKNSEQIKENNATDEESLKVCDLDLLLNKIIKQEKSSFERWKVITSGDRTSLSINLHKYLCENNSFYNHLQKMGYCFCNNKKDLNEKEQYIWSSKDTEYGRNGSIAGVVIELKNDNPERVFVRVFVTITTYGRKFVEETDLLNEETFAKLFKETVINSYKTIIETELAQMFIRHGIHNNFINRHTGRISDE